MAINAPLSPETIYGTPGDDLSLWGSTYLRDYIIYAGAGNDRMYGLGGYSSTHMHGGTGDDTYFVGLMDKVYEMPGEGRDTVVSGNDFSLYGMVVENLRLIDVNPATATGNSLNNVMDGNVGGNTLIGMGGNDTLDGHGGMDTLIGGPGKDTFAFGNMQETHGDTIVDFEHGVDRIDLPGSGTWTFIGTERFHNVRGELHVYHLKDGNTYISGDYYGDGSADFAIKVLGYHDFTKSDFII